MNTALRYSTRVVQVGGRRCKKSTLNDLVHLTPLRIPLMNPPRDKLADGGGVGEEQTHRTSREQSPLYIIQNTLLVHKGQRFK
jgi:hypothetical protein